MLRIRLFRVGKKNQPSFKVVVTERENPPSGGNFIEQVGFWNPLTKERILKEDRIKYWISVGAQPSDTVHNMLVGVGIIEGEKRRKHKKSKKKEKGTGEEATAVGGQAGEAEKIKEEPEKKEEDEKKKEAESKEEVKEEKKESEVQQTEEEK